MSEMGVGDDDTNLALDMAGSFGTYTTKSSTYCDESRSHKDSEAREARKDVKSIINVTKLRGGDKGRFSIVTTHGAENVGGDDESSIASADFEDNDFDALVGEFFWYLRDREHSKMTPSKHTNLSFSAPERTPRTISGNGRVLTPRNNIEQRDDDSTGRVLHVDPNKQTSYNNTSLVFDDVDSAVKTDDQKENMGRDTFIQKESDIETVEETRPPQTEEAPRFDDAIFTQTTIVLDNTEIETPSTRSDLGDRRDEIADVAIEPASISPRSSNYDIDSNRETRQCQDTSSPRNESNEESREEKNTRQDNHVTPSRDDSWNAVFVRKGLMGRTPTPLKHMSSEINDKTASPKETSTRNKSKVLSEFDGFKQKNELMWPPPRNYESCPPIFSPNSHIKSGVVSSKDIPPRDTVTASPEFDPDLELSRILDEPFMDSQTADLELSRILDDIPIDDASPGVNTIKNKTREFLERQKRILGEHSSISMKSLQASPSCSVSLSEDCEEQESGGSSNTKLERDDDSEKPESTSVILSSRSIVVETSSIAYTSRSPSAVLGRETPTNNGGGNDTASSERCLEPAGFTIEYDSNSLTPSESLSVVSHVSLLSPSTEAKRRTEESEPETENGTSPVFKESISAFTTVSKFSRDEYLSSSSVMVKSRPKISPKLSFDSAPSVDHPPENEGTSNRTPLSESVSSRKTYGSFVALSLSAIEKKPGTPTNDFQSTMILKTSIVFDSPAPGGLDTMDNTTPKPSPNPEKSSLMLGSPSPLDHSRSASGDHSLRLADSISTSHMSEASPTNDDASEQNDLISPLQPTSTNDVVAVARDEHAEDTAEDHSNLESVSMAVFPAGLHDSGSSFDKHNTRNEAAQSLEGNKATVLGSPCVQKSNGVTVLSPHSATSVRESESFDKKNVAVDITYPPSDTLLVQEFNQDTLGTSPHSSHSPKEPARTPVNLHENESLEKESAAEATDHITETTPTLDPLFLHEFDQDCTESSSHSSGGSKGSSHHEMKTDSPSESPISSATGNEHETDPPAQTTRKGFTNKGITPPPPEKVTQKKQPSSNFNNLLSQWKEKSAHNANGHFLSPPSHDTPPRYASLARYQDPDRRKSTGQYKFPLKQEEESSLPKWTPPQRSSARRRSIDISTISIPNKNVSSQKQQDMSAGHKKTVTYWNGMIQKSDEPNKEWASRSIIHRESTVPDNLMLTVPKQDPSANLAKASTLSVAESIDDDVPCTCNESAFSGNDHLMEFFLPKLGMAHTCGKRNPPILIDSDPIGLHHILRPWQVEFLRSCDIYRGDQLVKACKKRAGSLAGAMRKWRLERGMSCPKSVSCGMALHIWSRTCKYYVRTIRRQMADGMVEVEPPTLGDVMTTCEKQAETSFASTGGDEDEGETKDYM